MDVSTLQTLTEDLAAFLSEVTQSELQRPTQSIARDVGYLYLHLIDQNVSLAAAVTGEPIPRGQWADPTDRASLDASVDFYGGCGLEVGYRQTARLMENAFASATDSNLLCRVKGLPSAVEVAALYEMQVSNTVIHTWDIAQVLGLPYQPDPLVAQRILRGIVLRATQEQPGALEGATGAGSRTVDEGAVFECVLTLSGRSGLSHAPINAAGH